MRGVIGLVALVMGITEDAARRKQDQREREAFADSDPQATPRAQADHYANRARTLGMDRGNSEL